MNKYTIIGKSKEKIDSLSLATGASKFVDDFDLNDPLYLAFLYSPHAHAEILDIDDRDVRNITGVVDVFHYQNVKPVLHTTAGQGFPEPSPY
ncbi:aldehyde oxidase, partial [bacterium]|nr:aldehyde oxidase [bacterium]